MHAKADRLGNSSQTPDQFAPQLTPAQKTVWDRLASDRQKWIGPSELAKALSLSRQAVTIQLQKLVAAGFASMRQRGKTRKVYRAAFPAAGREQGNRLDEVWLAELKQRMRRAVDSAYKKEWEGVLRDALEYGTRPELLFDVKSVMHPAFCVDEDLRFTGWSSAFEKLLGNPVGCDLFTFFRRVEMHVYDPTHDVIDWQHHAIDEICHLLKKDGAVNQLPVYVRHADSTYDFLQVSCVFQRPFEGMQSIMPLATPYYVLFRQARDQRRGFYATIHHDLTSPILGIHIQIDRLLTHLEHSGFTPALEKDLPKSLRTVSATIKGLLSLLKSYQLRDSGEDSLVDPVSVLNSVYSTCRLLHPNINFDDTNHMLKDREGYYLMRGDVSGLHEAFQNAIKNASEAVAARGEAGLTEGRISLTSMETAPSEISISISDNGIGMSAETLSRVYSAGFTTKQAAMGHTGLGLARLLKVAEIAGGQPPKFESQRGVGTTVHITLPVVRRARP